MCIRDRGIGVREGHIKIVDATLVEAAVRPPRKPKATGDDGGTPEEPERPLDPDMATRRIPSQD